MEEPGNKKFSDIYRLGAISAISIVLLFLIELIIVVIFGLPPVFGSAETWLSALQNNRVLGILQTFSLDIIAVALHIPLYVALFFFLQDIKKGYGLLVLSAIISFIGIAVYFSSNPTLSMVYLSDQYSAATNGMQKTSILNSAQAMIALWNGTAPIAATNLFGFAGVLISIVMFQTRKFPKSVAIIGMVGNMLQLGPPVPLMPHVYVEVDPFFIFIGAVLLLIWYVAIAKQLWRET
jgi:hypothetical protein